MSKRAKILLAVVAAVLVLAAAGTAGWWFFLREREGAHDTRITHPTTDQIPSFKGALIHSMDEFDAGKQHLTAWYVVQKPDGKYVRHHVETVWDWDRLAEGGKTRVIQLPESWMNEHLPVEPGVPA